MITTKYTGRLGNHLSQYFTARLLAERYNLEFPSMPIEGFPETSKTIEGRSFDGLYGLNKKHLSFNTACELIEEHAIKKGKGVYLGGLYGLNYREFYENNMDLAYKWLAIDDEIEEPDYKVKDNDLLISIRNGDFYSRKVSLPIEYYKSILESKEIDYNRVYIVSDDCNHEFMMDFMEYDPIFLTCSPLSQFKFALNFKYTIASHSTFCWFHVLLNKNIRKCYFPIVAMTRHSAWSENLIYKKNCDLRIDLPYMEFVYNIPIEWDKSRIKFQDGWFGSVEDFRNSPIRTRRCKETTDEILSYHKNSSYRFMNIKSK